MRPVTCRYRRPIHSAWLLLTFRILLSSSRWNRLCIPKILLSFLRCHRQTHSPNDTIITIVRTATIGGHRNTNPPEKWTKKYNWETMVTEVMKINSRINNPNQIEGHELNKVEIYIWVQNVSIIGGGEEDITSGIRKAMASFLRLKQIRNSNV